MRSIVYYYTHVSRPFEEVKELLTGAPEQWLPPPAEASEDEWVVCLNADGALPATLAKHDALVSLGTSNFTEGTMRRSLVWRSASSERLIPSLEADLELAELNGTGCQLSLMGSYRPPLSVVGAAGDRLLGHRVAEACVRRFVLDVAERIEQSG